LGAENWEPADLSIGADGASSGSGDIRIPTENSEKLGRKTEGSFLLAGMLKKILHSRQDRNENENRFCAYALTRGYSGWR
jgi:hypothetical protein